jgi:U3 small nucleolar ribonucleoprotein protein LCP5
MSPARFLCATQQEQQLCIFYSYKYYFKVNHPQTSHQSSSYLYLAITTSTFMKGMSSSRDDLRSYLDALNDSRNVIDRLIESLDDELDDADGIDFLKVKNSLMISYLIDLSLLLRRYSESSGENGIEEANSSKRLCLERLQEMRAIFDKIRPLEKKMRYQIDRVLALSTSSFAVLNTETIAEEEHGGLSNTTETDPLSFKPNPENMILGDDSSDEDRIDDDDIFKGRGKTSGKLVEVETERPALYKPPRLAAVPFHEKERSEEKEARIKKSAMDRMKKSELLQTIRAQFSDKPEEDDLRGGANVGKQRETARRFAERVAEKDRYEEENMVRLSTSRKEKKMREKIMRDEFSNLRAISDVGNLASGVSSAFQSDKKSKRSFNEDDQTSQQPKSRRLSQPRNQYQEALYGKTTSSKKDRKKNKLKR